ncbi:MAG: 50S ribosomal protein L3 [Candidatus Aenigmarchaeota archaeon]|nr:50S ribosomal protein L3 [Candidatus Aenigmarchaeota archaeon]
MAKSHRPRKGSRAFWPRKRAKRIFPSVKSVPDSRDDNVAPLAFAGYKAGMTSVSYIDNRKASANSGKEIVEAVTVLDCQPLSVIGMKLYRQGERGLVSEGTVWHENLPRDLGRALDVPKKPHMKKELVDKKLDGLSEIRIIVSTQPRGSGIGKKKPEVFEIPLSGDVEKQWAYALERLGKEILPADVFAQGEVVDVKAVSKGKGFSGVVKRFGVKIRGRKHGGKRRLIGNIGSRTPARVLPGAIAMAGQLGFQTRTEYNKKILKIGEGGIVPRGGFVNYGRVPKNYMLIQGSVPGPRKRLVVLRKAMRWKGSPAPVEIKHVSLEPQQ